MLRSKVLFSLFLTSGLYAQVEPTAGTWKTWVLSSGNQMRLPAPPSEGDSAAERKWLKDFMAGADASARAQIAYWDAGSPAYRWIQIAAQEMVSRNVPAPLFTRDMALSAWPCTMRPSPPGTVSMHGNGRIPASAMRALSRRSLFPGVPRILRSTR